MKKRLYLLLPVLGAALVLMLVVGLSGRMFAGAPTPSIPEKLLYCGTCHSMEKETDTWQKSPHSSVACLQCHEESDVAWVKHELTDLGDSMAGKAQAKSLHAIPLKAPDARCEECHADQMDEIMKDVTPAPMTPGAKTAGTPGKPMAIKAAHAVHTEKVGLSCAECHTDSAHGTVLTGDALRDKAHEQCMSCHVEKQVKIAVIDSTSCGACHTDVASVTPADHKNAATWQKAHGKAAAAGTCGACHLDESAGTHAQIARPENFPSAAKDTCVACHSGMQMPHPDSFLSTHGKVSLKTPAGTCEACHSAGSQATAATGGAASCTSCHASSMPHPDNFLAQHGAAASANPASCATCHSPNNIANPTAYHASSNFCSDCHGTAMPHPADFLSKHGAAANADPSSCTNCHSPKNPINPGANYASVGYCQDCHLTPMPHPASFLSSHGAEAQKSPATCDACHSSKNVARPTAPHANAGYCASCHDSYEHEAGWVADHGSNIDQSCSTCHTLQGQPGQHNACSACHTGNGEWHPKMWFVSHAREVDKNGDEACMTCHNEVEPSCSKCHRDR
jgi:hypothetical protein